MELMLGFIQRGEDSQTAVFRRCRADDQFRPPLIFRTVACRVVRDDREFYLKGTDQTTGFLFRYNEVYIAYILLDELLVRLVFRLEEKGYLVIRQGRAEEVVDGQSAGNYLKFVVQADVNGTFPSVSHVAGKSRREGGVEFVLAPEGLAVLTPELLPSVCVIESIEPRKIWIRRIDGT